MGTTEGQQATVLTSLRHGWPFRLSPARPELGFPGSHNLWKAMP
jgi:hypothetical protein